MNDQTLPFLTIAHHLFTLVEYKEFMSGSIERAVMSYHSQAKYWAKKKMQLSRLLSRSVTDKINQNGLVTSSMFNLLCLIINNN
jgi:hypothetical protein